MTLSMLPLCSYYSIFPLKIFQAGKKNNHSITKEKETGRHMTGRNRQRTEKQRQTDRFCTVVLGHLIKASAFEASL